MPAVRGESVLRFIRKLAVREQTARLPDCELLERFLSTRDEDAFRALVRRHGRMVLRVCIQILENEHDAEDAFQATFLVLSRKASSVKKQDSVGSWLFGVASHAAAKLKRNLVRRRSHESQAGQPKVTDPRTALTLREAQTILNEELVRLPEKYRAPLVLCSLEGLTRDEAAQQLGVPFGKLKDRLQQARKRLRVRLASRGLTLSGAFVASVFSEQTASAAIPAGLLNSTVQAATSVAAGCAATSVVSAKVVALTEGVIKTMLLTKLKTGLALLIVAGMLTCGFGALKFSLLAVPQSDQKATAKDRQKQKTDKDKLQGTWLLVSAIVEGEDRAGGVKKEGHKRTFKGDEFTIEKAGQPGSQAKVQYKIDPNKKPKTMDLIPGAGPDKGKTVPAIYKIEDDTLTICEGDVGKDRPTEFSSTAENGWILLVFERERQKDKEERGKPARFPASHFAKEASVAYAASSDQTAEDNARLRRRGLARPEDDSLKNTLWALEERRSEALAKGDWQTQQKFLADDFIGVSARAARSDKSAIIEGAKRLRCVDWKTRDVEVRRVSKDVAILTYIYGCKEFSPEGDLIRTLRDHRATLVWALRNGGWVIVFCQETVLPGGQ
jgi:RNA polymerase sigma factor (sigma-70 family)